MRISQGPKGYESTMCRIAFALGMIVSTPGCAARYVIANPTPTRSATNVAASFDRTWDAVIDVFAAGNLPIATIERASGLIVAAPLAMARTNAAIWTDCGHHPRYSDPRDRAYATRGEFNVLVRPAGPTSTVRVTIRWSLPDLEARAICESTGVYERDLEDQIKRRAESSR